MPRSPTFLISDASTKECTSSSPDAATISGFALTSESSSLSACSSLACSSDVRIPTSRIALDQPTDPIMSSSTMRQSKRRESLNRLNLSSAAPVKRPPQSAILNPHLIAPARSRNVRTNSHILNEKRPALLKTVQHSPGAGSEPDNITSGSWPAH